MIDHLSVKVRDYQKSKAFYSKALEPLGYQVVMEIGQACGVGPRGKPMFWIAQAEPTSPIHFAFSAEDRKTVDAFYNAALAAGGKDNGAPGIREHYHPNYYGAFVIDPDGHNVEAVCHKPQQ